MWVNNLYDGVGKLEWPEGVLWMCACVDMCICLCVRAHARRLPTPCPDEKMCSLGAIILRTCVLSILHNSDHLRAGSKHPGSFTVMAGVGGKPMLVHGKNFTGHFLEGKKHGTGYHVFYDGSFYQGEYERGVYHGSGTFQVCVCGVCLWCVSGFLSLSLSLSLSRVCLCPEVAAPLSSAHLAQPRPSPEHSNGLTTGSSRSTTRIHNRNTVIHTPRTTTAVSGAQSSLSTLSATYAHPPHHNFCLPSHSPLSS